MGVLSRINDIVRSNLNELVSKAENPEKLLSQAILDMQSHLRRARKQVLDTIAAEKMMEKKRVSVLDLAQRWERRAGMALTQGDEALARQALLRKKEQEGQARALEDQIRIQREYVGALRQSLVALEDRYRDARTRKEALIARAKVARARKQTAEELSPIKTGGARAESRAFDTFERMEDKVLSLEAQVEAFAEMAHPEANTKDDAALDARFSELERGSEVEDQLVKLKKQLGLNGKSPAASKVE